MAKRRKVTSVALTNEQRERLERLWFYFGNYGPKTTPGNHSFIQGFLEHGIDERSLNTRRTPKSEIPTPECEAAVDAILTMKSSLGPGGERDGSGRLRLISNAPECKPAEADPEMKAILDDMKRRYRVMHERMESTDNTPDAA